MPNTHAFLAALSLANLAGASRAREHTQMAMCLPDMQRPVTPTPTQIGVGLQCRMPVLHTHAYSTGVMLALCLLAYSDMMSLLWGLHEP